MKTLQYKIIVALLSIGIAANAQKFDKKLLRRIQY